MRQKIWRAVQPVAFSSGYSLPRVFGVPVDDNCGEQVEARHAEMLPFGDAVADFTLATDAQGVFRLFGLSR